MGSHRHVGSQCRSRDLERQRLARYSRYQHEAVTAAADGDDGCMVADQRISVFAGFSCNRSEHIHAATSLIHAAMQVWSVSATPTLDRSYKSVCHQHNDAGEDHGSRLAAAIQQCITSKGWVQGPTVERNCTRLMTWRMLKNRFGRTGVGRAGRSRTNATSV